MGKSLSSDLRLRLLECVGCGKSCRAATAQFAVAPSTVIRLVRRHLETCRIEPAPQGRPFGHGKLGPYRYLLGVWSLADSGVCSGAIGNGDAKDDFVCTGRVRNHQGHGVDVVK